MPFMVIAGSLKSPILHSPFRSTKLETIIRHALPMSASSDQVWIAKNSSNNMYNPETSCLTSEPSGNKHYVDENWKTNYDDESSIMIGLSVERKNNSTIVFNKAMTEKQMKLNLEKGVHAFGIIKNPSRHLADENSYPLPSPTVPPAPGPLSFPFPVKFQSNFGYVIKNDSMSSAEEAYVQFLNNETYLADHAFNLKPCETPDLLLEMRAFLMWNSQPIHSHDHWELRRRYGVAIRFLEGRRDYWKSEDNKMSSVYDSWIQYILFFKHTVAMSYAYKLSLLSSVPTFERSEVELISYVLNEKYFMYSIGQCHMFP